MKQALPALPSCARRPPRVGTPIARAIIVCVRSLIALLALGFWAGCTSQLYCDNTSPTSPCVRAGGAPEAAITAAAAGAVWVAGGGCAVAGCQHPLVCNEGTGLCEHPRCGEHRDCPSGMRCDHQTSTCE
jgi:hypothetical protein